MTNTKRKESPIRGAKERDARVNRSFACSVRMHARVRAFTHFFGEPAGYFRGFFFFFLLMSLVSLSPSETEKNTHHCSISDIIQPVLLDHSDEILAA